MHVIQVWHLIVDLIAGDNVYLASQCGAIEAVVVSMKTHMENVNLQEQALRCIANMTHHGPNSVDLIANMPI